MFGGKIARCFAVLCTFVAMWSSAIAQNGTPGPTPPNAVKSASVLESDGAIRVRTDLVSFTVSVTDRQGHFVPGLLKENFSIKDDGKIQQIKYFSDFDSPISIGILFDVSGSMVGEKIEQAKNALKIFINTCSPADELFLIAFNDKAELLLDQSNDADRLLNRFAAIVPAGETSLYDAVYLGADKVDRGKYRKKVIVIISDGEDNSSRYNFGEVSRMLKESNVTVYAVGIIDRFRGGRRLGMIGEFYLNDLTVPTGGRAFYPHNAMQMYETFEQLALELRHQYSIGYTPENFRTDGSWHKLSVGFSRHAENTKGAIRVRKGYFATSETVDK